MNETSIIPPAGDLRILPRIITSVGCVIIALLAALAWKHHQQPQHPTPAAPVAKVTSILDTLPAPLLSTTSGKSLQAALSRTRQFPEQAENWVMLGDTLAQVQREGAGPSYYQHAESAYQEALRLKPNLSAAFSGMAWVTGGRHQFDQSTEWANRALKLDPECVEAYGILGDAALELGDYSAAYDHYQKMMDLRPDLSSWSRGAHLLWLTGNPSKAMRLMEQAIRSGGPFAENTAWCRARLATMLFHDGALVPAQQAIQPSLDSGSKNSHVMLIAAKIAAANGDFVKAQEIYTSLSTEHPNQEALAGLGDLMAVQGKPAEAESYYQQVEAVHADYLKSGVHDHAFMAKFLADHQRNLVEALRMAEEHKLTRNVQEADTLAWVYLKNGQVPQAIAAMKYALSQNTPDAERHYHAGLIAMAHGDLTAARKHLQTALTINPHFSLLQAPLAAQKLQAMAQAVP